MGRTTERIIDEYLIASAKARERQAFAQLVRPWQRKLVAHAWRLTGDIESARDAVQAAWVEIVRGLDRLQDERAFPAWAYRIVSRSCARQIGSAQRRREITTELAREPLAQDVIELIRQRSVVPIIVVSARHQENEKVAALDQGADDYVNRPFEIGDFMARIRVALRRSEATRSVPLEVIAGGLKIELATKRVSLEAERVSLSPKEWKLLQELSLSAGQVVSHQRLLAAGWSSRVTDHQYLRINIGLLRQKLEADASRPVLLLTEPGIGYRLAAPAGFEVEVRFA